MKPTPAALFWRFPAANCLLRRRVAHRVHVRCMGAWRCVTPVRFPGKMRLPRSACRQRGEIDHELIWLSVSLVSLTIAALWLAIGLPWPRCVFHELTGLPCVTCGMTRCGIQFFHGHFLAALKWDPLVFAAAVRRNGV